MTQRTNKPCPGCGGAPRYNQRPGFRDVDKVCSACQDLLANARQVVNAEQERLRRSPQNLGAVGRNDWHYIPTWSPDVSGSANARVPHEATDRLRHALAELARAVSWPTIVADSTTREAAVRLDDTQTLWRALPREFPPGVLDAVVELDAALLHALQEVAAANFRAGSDALMRLAAGSITMDDFNALLAPRKGQR